MSEVVVVDYGSGNTFSMLNALRKIARPGRDVVLTGDPAVIERAERLVLPGVGAFPECRRRLFATGLVDVLTDSVRRGVPLLGVCVGMQILGDEGHEFEVVPGLGWVSGVVRKLRVADSGGPRKLPHVGWTPIEPRHPELFAEIPAGCHFYFVHSYALACRDENDIAATARYGETFAAAVVRDNIFGCQFHPEKSGPAGLRVLEAFCRWKPR